MRKVRTRPLLVAWVERRAARANGGTPSCGRQSARAQVVGPQLCSLSTPPGSPSPRAGVAWSARRRAFAPFLCSGTGSIPGRVSNFFYLPWRFLLTPTRKFSWLVEVYCVLVKRRLDTVVFFVRARACYRLYSHWRGTHARNRACAAIPMSTCPRC